MQKCIKSVKSEYKNEKKKEIFKYKGLITYKKEPSK